MGLISYWKVDLLWFDIVLFVGACCGTETSEITVVNGTGSCRRVALVVGVIVEAVGDGEGDCEELSS